LMKFSLRKQHKIDGRPAAIESMPRPPRNFDPVEVQRGQIFAAESKVYIDIIKRISTHRSDAAVMAYIRSIGLSLASERPLDFEAVYDQMLGDPRIPDETKDLIASVTLDLQALDLQIEVLP